MPKPEMTADGLLKLFSGIKMWSRGGERAPHKPLLLLLVLARLQQTQSSGVRYSDIDKPLGQLLTDYGPRRTSVHPEYPFWHLQTDGFWVVNDADLMQMRKGKHSPTTSEFKKHDPVGLLSPEIETLLKSQPKLLSEATQCILEMSFPVSIHADILAEIGFEIDVTETVTRKKRDPKFRARVLRAYEHRCAVCGFDLRLGSSDLALEAAHIKWHQAGGPDIESNGLALCSIHHKMLDRGAFSISDEYRVMVSQDVHGSSGMDEYLLRFCGVEIRRPQSEGYLADLGYLGWHRGEVFRGPGREG